MARVRTRVIAHESPLGRWEIASRPLGAVLRPYVRQLHGFVEATPGPLRRREAPLGAVVMIVSLEHEWWLQDASGATMRRTSFVAGLQDGPVLVEHGGASYGMEVYFTPLGARVFFGVPLDALTGRVLELEEVLGREASALTEQLCATPGWEGRFDSWRRRSRGVWRPVAPRRLSCVGRGVGWPPVTAVSRSALWPPSWAGATGA